MRQIPLTFAVVLASAVLLSACLSREVSKVEAGQQKQEKKAIPVVAERDIDILFVIDDSDSMAQEQASLVQNFPGFIDKLRSIEGGLPNVHIGVISTDMGARNGIANCDETGGKNGALQSDLVGNSAVCSDGSVSLADSFIRDVDDDGDPNTPRVTNYEGELENVFSCIAELGITGCGFEQQLEAMRASLTEASENDNGFLRDNAFLAVIFITDEDDCSTKNNEMFRRDITAPDSALGPLDSFRCFEFGVQCVPDNPRGEGEKTDCVPRENSPYMYDVEEYVTFLKNLKSDPRKVIVAGIFGIDPETGEIPINVFRDDRGDDNENNDLFKLDPACTIQQSDGTVGQATPAVRLQAFLDQFPDRNTADTICDEDLTDALDLVASLLAKVLDNPFCLTVDVDQDPDTPELDYDCQVSDVLSTGDGIQEDPLVACDNPDSPTNTPCWYIQKNEEGCSNAGEPYQELVVERGSDTVSSDTQVVVNCAVN
ncbi:MAG: hypothetical protein Tsb0020_30010 [Haliangiales bacterium]